MSISGNNDYNKKLIPAETVVSRTLQAKNRFWTNVIWRTGKPALDSEWNLINDAASEFLCSMIRSETPSGWMELGKNKYLSGNSGTANNFQFYAKENESTLDVPNAIVNGWPVLVGGVNHTDTSLNSITLDVPSSTLGQHRWDFVFLEVFRAQVRSRDTNNIPIAQNKPSLSKIYAYGNTQFGGTHFDDDLVDPAINPSTSGIETSQRVQLQYRIRKVAGVNFANTFSTGFDQTNVQGQGAGINAQVTGYQFTNMGTELNDSGLWRAGAGDDASRTALGTADGYSYAIPMFKIFRRVQAAYSDTSVNGQNATAIAIGGTSDRPDGKFYNDVDATDIVDTRFKISMGNIDYAKLVEENLHYLLSGQLKSSKQQLVQHDSISDTDLPGYNDFLSNQGCSGKRTIWTDAVTNQTEIFGICTVNSNDSAADIYRDTPYSANWVISDEIVVQVVARLPVGTTISIDGIFLENKSKTDISSQGTWNTMDPTRLVFTISNTSGMNDGLGNGLNIWIYYTITIAAAQGLTYVPDDVLKMNYVNYSSFPSASGYVVRGSRFEPSFSRFQDLLNHPFENKKGPTVVTYKESDFVKEKKQVDISPLIRTTSTDGLTRRLEVKTSKFADKTVYLPYKIQHLRGIYNASSGGTELATKATTALVSAVNSSENSLLIYNNNFIADITSLKYDPTGAFGGGEHELIGVYAPVYQHYDDVGGVKGSYVRLYDSSGNIFNFLTNIYNPTHIPPLPAHFKWTGRYLPAHPVSGWGMILNDYLVNCSGSDNVGSFPIDTDPGASLWIDMDYLGAIHDGAELKIIYEYTPYQGSDVGGQNFKLIHKREKGVFFNNGTGGSAIDTTGGTGTSNSLYTPMSPRLPGIYNDYLRDGTLIELSSIGVKRKNTDALFSASYELYGYHGGGSLHLEDFTMTASPEITTRGFLDAPFMQVIFEAPFVDQTYAEFILVLLVMDKSTHEVFLFVQIGDKGIQMPSEGDVYMDFFRLNEKLLIKG